MTICGSQSCACALRSDTLTVTGAGTPGSPWVIEQAEFTDITALQNAVDNLEASVAVLLSDVSALQVLTTDHATAIARLDAMQSGSISASSGTTSGTTPLTIDSTSLSTVPVAGVLFLWGAAIYSKTVSTDVFQVSTRINGVAHATAMRDQANGTAGVLTMGGPTAISASTAPSIDYQLTRISGTGTATVASATLRWLFLPS